jgi:hypothetical protein
VFPRYAIHKYKSLQSSGFPDNQFSGHGTADVFEKGDVSLESLGRKWKKKAVEFDTETLS